MDSTANLSQLDGIRLERSDRNQILRSSTSENGKDGLFVDAQSQDVLVQGNAANQNGDDGIDVQTPGTSIARNTANSNTDLGIEAVEGVMDGGGNTAFGNGNPFQCLNVVCK